MTDISEKLRGVMQCDSVLLQELTNLRIVNCVQRAALSAIAFRSNEISLDFGR